MGVIDQAIGSAESGPYAEAVDETTLAANLFDLNIAALKAKGVVCIDEPADNQTLELRAIKRRLLRRMGFLQRFGRDVRAMRQTGRQRNVILVTSTRPGEGKTFTAVNLAVSLAVEDNQKVLLVDGDVIRPKVRSYFDFPASKGLTDRVLDPSLPISGLAWRARQAPLTVLSEGSAVDNPTAVLGSDGAAKAFVQMSTMHPDRLVIVDAPPMLATTEAIALARHADEVVFVVQADSTPEPAVATALDELLEINPNVSLVLNRCLIPAGGAHYGSYHHYERTGAGPMAGSGQGDE